MRFETIPEGESRQLNGPWFGLRVLSAEQDRGARLTVDRLEWPLHVLPCYVGEFGQINADGPITLAIADEAGEDVGRISATPQPPTGNPRRLDDRDTYPALAHNGASVWLSKLFLRPAWARSVEIIALPMGPVGASVFSGVTGLTATLVREEPDGPTPTSVAPAAYSGGITGTNNDPNGAARDAAFMASLLRLGHPLPAAGYRVRVVPVSSSGGVCGLATGHSVSLRATWWS